MRRRKKKRRRNIILEMRKIEDKNS